MQAGSPYAFLNKYGKGRHVYVRAKPRPSRSAWMSRRHRIVYSDTVIDVWSVSLSATVHSRAKQASI